jgi:hypothetical protein
MLVKTFVHCYFHRTGRFGQRVGGGGITSQRCFSSHVETAWICCALLTWSRCRPAVLTADRIFGRLGHLGRGESRSRGDHSQYIVPSVAADEHE